MSVFRACKAKQSLPVLACAPRCAEGSCGCMHVLTHVLRLPCSKSETWRMTGRAADGYDPQEYKRMQEFLRMRFDKLSVITQWVDCALCIVVCGPCMLAVSP